MKKFLRPLQISILAVLLLTNSLTAFATKPVKYSSTEGNYSITFPGTPEESSQEIPTDNGSFTLHGTVYKATENNAFAVAYSDPLEKPVSKKGAYAILAQEQKGELNTPGTTMDGKDKKNSYKGYPGLYYKTRKDNMYGITQTYLIKTRLYQIVITKADKYPTNKEIKAFIGSFKLLNHSPKTQTENIPSI
ncbi:hypothetical protein HZA40_03445 [Candidatus Peregrinibacteria bacterium]|nr:hypothetical protein [Candidatus Peregrinibacteria bacterium]